MPPIRKKSADEEIARLRKELEAEKKKIEKYERERQVQALRSKDLIPCPPGQSGRSYQLFEAMGISKTAYSAIRAIVRVHAGKFLDFRHGIRKQQDRERMDRLKSAILQVAPFFEYYQAAWPIQPIIKQILGSSSKRYRKAVNFLENLDEKPNNWRGEGDSQKPGKDEGDCDSEDDRRSAGVCDFENEDEDSGSSDEESEDESEEEEDKGQYRSNRKKRKSAGYSDEESDQPKKRHRADNTKAADAKLSKVNSAKTKLGNTKAVKANPVDTNAAKPKPADTKAVKANPVDTKAVKPKPAGAKAVKANPIDTNAAKPKPAGTKAVKAKPVGTNAAKTKPADTKAVKANPVGTNAAKPKAVPVMKAAKPKAANAKGAKPKAVDARAAKPKTKAAKPKAKPTATEPMNTDSSYPSHCPAPYCDDVFPPDPTDEIKAAYAASQKKGRGQGIATLQLCGMISAHYDKDKCIADALEQGWPLEFDLRDLVDRVVNRKADLRSLIKNEIVLGTSAVWRDFVQNLSDSATRLGRFQYQDILTKEEAVLDAAGNAGYYGPDGHAIIGSVLRHKIFYPRIEAEADLFEMLTLLLMEGHGSNNCYTFEGFWDNADGTCVPLNDFIDYIATPYAINLLIIEDLGAVGSSLTEHDANRIRQDSKEVGRALHDHHDHPMVDDLMMEIAKPQKPQAETENMNPDDHAQRDDLRITLTIPPRHRKAHAVEVSHQSQAGPSTSNIGEDTAILRKAPVIRGYGRQNKS